MKLERIIRKVFSEPWLITSAAHASIVSLIEGKLNDTVERYVDRPGTDLFDEPLPQMEIKDGIAVIPVHGVMGARLGMIEKSCGAVGVEDIAADLQAASQANVKAAILHFDSPGGTVGGTPELADCIAACGVPVYAFTDGLMASAAYWAGCSANGIFATSSAEVGSIGVYLPHVDKSKAFEAMGYQVRVFKAGKYKAAGFPGTSLTEDQSSEMQAGVDKIYSMFTAHVRNHRGNIADETMQGQCFMGQDAVDAGLVDEIVPSLAYLIASLKK